MSKFFKGASSKPARGIYIVEPHAQWLATGEKPLLLKSRRYNIENEPMFLLGKKNYGVITFEEPFEMPLSDFEKYAPQHKVSREEHENWWKKYDKLYAYPVKEFKPYSTPKKYEYKKGAQTFIKMGKFFKEAVSQNWKRQVLGISEEFTRITKGTHTPEDIKKVQSVYKKALEKNVNKFVKDRPNLVTNVSQDDHYVHAIIEDKSTSEKVVSNTLVNIGSKEPSMTLSHSYSNKGTAGTKEHLGSNLHKLRLHSANVIGADSANTSTGYGSFKLWSRPEFGYTHVDGKEIDTVRDGILKSVNDPTDSFSKLIAHKLTKRF